MSWRGSTGSLEAQCPFTICVEEGTEGAILLSCSKCQFGDICERKEKGCWVVVTGRLGLYSFDAEHTHGGIAMVKRFIRRIIWIINGSPTKTFSGFHCGLCGKWNTYPAPVSIPSYLYLYDIEPDIGICLDREACEER